MQACAFNWLDHSRRGIADSVAASIVVSQATNPDFLYGDCAENLAAPRYADLATVVSGYDFSMRSATLMLCALLMFAAPASIGEGQSTSQTRIPQCGKLSPGQRWISWGQYGLKFQCPKRGVKIIGGKPDVDYVKFVIRPVSGNAALVVWFGGMAFDPQPRGKQVVGSITFKQSKLIGFNGTEIGLDSRGQKPDMTVWRHFGVRTEGAEYDKASDRDAALFDRIIETACLGPYPNT